MTKLTEKEKRDYMFNYYRKKRNWVKISDGGEMTNREDKEREKRRLTLGIPRGAPKAVKVFSLTKEGREFLERLWEAFPELRPRPTSIEEPIPMTTDETVAHYIHEAVEAESEPSDDEKLDALLIDPLIITETLTEQPIEAELVEQIEAEKQDMIHAQELAKAATEARKAKSEE